jgi:hypothetical protein
MEKSAFRSRRTHRNGKGVYTPAVLKSAERIDGKGIVKRSLGKDRKDCAQSVIEVPPHCMHEFQNKGDKKWAIRK